MRPTKKRSKSISSTTALGSIANSVSKSIKNVMNANKKDDDFGFSGNDIQGRRRRKDVSLLYKVANINPLFLIICSGFCVVVFIVAMVLLFSGVSPSQSTNQYRRTPSPYHRKATDYRKKTETSNIFNKNKANDQETVDTEIEKLLNQLQKSANDISASLYNDLDKQMSRLMHKFCLNELDFLLDYEAKSTFEAHVSAIFQSLLDKEKMAYLGQETVLTQYGTLTDEFAVTKGVKYGQCSLLNGLLAKAQKWNLIGNVYDSKPNLFAKKASDIWNENKDRFAKRDINAAAMELISLAKNDNHNSHLAKQLIPGLISQFCPNVFAFLDKQAKSAKTGQDKDPKFEFINSVDDVLLQLHNHGNIAMNKNEIPAVDVNGFLVAVDKFSLSDENTFESQWASCALIDKIVYYHNVDIDKQAKVLIDEIRDSNYYAFESQIDIMMLEHCPRTVKVLKADKAGSDPANVYISVFRGELTSFAHKVAHGMFIGDTQSFVVTRHGGIMHKNEVSDGRYTECDVIKYIGKQTAVGQNGKRETFDEHMFDPEYHSNTFAELQKELHHSAQDMEKDAAAIIKHAVNDEHYELKHLITNMMHLYHSKQISTVTPDALESMVSEITQYVSALLQIENEDTVTWPASHFAVFDVDNGKLVLLDKESEAFSTGNKIESQFFTKVFKVALEAKKEAPQRNDNGGGGGKAENLDQIRAYVSVLLQDIQSQTDIGGLRKDIETDLSHYCADLWNKLSTRSRRVMLSQLLTTLKSNNDRITDPVVTVDGSIKSAQTVDGSREQMMETCAFITELLTQRI